MNKYSATFFIVLGFLAACTSSSSTTVEGSFADVPANATKTSYPGNENLVKVVVPDINGNVAAEGDYLQGLRHGVWTEYHPNGVVKTVTSYVQGKKQGPQLVLDQNGQLQEKIDFSSDQLHGLYVKYNRNKVKEEREYQQGVLHGMVKIYHDNGKIMEESPFSNGVRDGIAKWYNTDGEVIIEYVYENGEWIKDEAIVPASTEVAE